MRFPLRNLGAALFAVATGLLFAFPVAADEGRRPNDDYYDDQWHLRHIRAHEAWRSSLGFEGIPIAIIDSGVDIDHPDLKDNIWRNFGEIAGNGIDDDANGYVDDAYGWDFVGGDNDPRPDLTGDFSTLGANHGTILAGIAAAKGDNGKGVVGVSWQSSIMAIRALDSSGAGDPDKIVEAVNYAVRNGAKIVNLSFTGPSHSDALAEALRRAYDAGVFVVAAAGNAVEGDTGIDLDARPLYPVCLDKDATENFVYGVAATDEQDKRASFSGFGAGCVDISAPGTRLLSTQFYRAGDKRFGSPYGGYFNGTSLAAAEVSGVVALLRALDHNLTPKQLMNILTESAVNIDALNPGYFGRLGRGRIDAAKAVEIVARKRQGEAPPVATATLIPGGSTSGVVVAAPGAGRSPEIRLFTADGSYVRSFLAFPASYKGGVSLAMGDFDGSSRKTIVAGALSGGAPHVRIFDINSRAIGGFFAYGEDFRGGVNVAVADLDGDGIDEIVTGAGTGGGPHVRIFGATGRASGGFFAFDEKSRAGVNVAAADLDGDGKAEIIATQRRGDLIRIFDGKGQLRSFFRVAERITDAPFAADLDGDGAAEIVLRRRSRAGTSLFAYRTNGSIAGEYDGATFAGAGLASGPRRIARGPLAVGAAANAAATVTVRKADGPVVGFSVYERWFLGGTQAVLTD